MREFKYVPQACKGDEAKYSGHVMVRMPTLDERYEFFETVEFKKGQQGEVIQGIENVPAMRKMCKLAEPFFKEVAVKRVSDGFEFKSYEDLSYDKDASLMIQEIAGQIMNGFNVVKN